MAVEDAGMLGTLLKKYPNPADLHNVLLLYEAMRKGRATMVSKASVESRYFTQLPDGRQQEERDAFLLSHQGIQKGHLNIRSQKEFLDELFGYNVFDVAAKATFDLIPDNKRPKHGNHSGMDWSRSVSQTSVEA